MTNIAWSMKLLQELAAQGVREIVLCAGARNAPLVALLGTAEGFKVHSFFEERSAGFFAIGRMQTDPRPVVVCTTSGTAVAELLPAVVEAHYQSLPLIVLSADRPKIYRGSGAPQTIVQPGIFSSYVGQEWDLDSNSSVPELQVQRQPLHINVCFDEPLLDASIESWSVNGAVVNSLGPGSVNSDERHPLSTTKIIARKPLVIAGRLSQAQAQAVAPLLKKWKRPVYAEALSQLRGCLEELEIVGGEDSIANLDCDGVIRIGAVPTLRFWRDLEKNHVPVWHFSVTPFSGLPRAKEVWPLNALSDAGGEFEPWSAVEWTADRKRAQMLERILFEFPLSEPAWVRRLSEWPKSGSRILLGNSLPIREWDLAAARGKELSFYGNRGTNGIDGLISTFLGIASAETSNWAVIGDLSTLYDLSGPWALRGLGFKDINLVVINNGGGKIFERMFENPMFENSHSVNFENWAAMWGWEYQRLQKVVDVPAPQSQPRVLEIIPDAAQTRAFYEAREKFKC